MPRMIRIDPLPFPKEALEPMISGRTLEFHYEKHHKGYLNKLLEILPESYQNLSLEQVIQKSWEEKQTAVFNNAAQVFNHSFYWESLTPQFEEPNADMIQLINRSFGSYEKFKKEFAQQGISQFGSGWVWLVYRDGALHLVKTANAETPITENGYQKVLFTCDVWEHAYYLDYQNRRPDYLEKFINQLVNWDFAQTNLA